MDGIAARQRGIVAVVIAIGLLALLAMVGLALDIGPRDPEQVAAAEHRGRGRPVRRQGAGLAPAPRPRRQPRLGRFSTSTRRITRNWPEY